MAPPENISVRHQNYSADWWTPIEWLEWVNRTIGPEFCDPCPGDWDESRECGLSAPWGARTYCNHPGSRGSAKKWWRKYIAEQRRHDGRMQFVWCQFNVEAIRHLRPSPFSLPGWLIWPRERTPFVWGGADMEGRVHGEPCRSPGNCAVWWTNVHPATPPVDCVVVRTS